MFSILDVSADNLIRDAVAIPIKSYRDYVTLVSTLKLNESYPINIDGVPCTLKPHEDGGQNILLNLDIPHTVDGESLFMVVVVADKRINEALLMLELPSVVKSFTIPTILKALNDFFFQFEI